jgi:5-formyltetrahydrofolate cyclo-ligase
MTLIDDKRTLRSAMLAWRGALSDDERRAAADGLLATFQRELPFETPAVVSGFWPIKDEIDIRPLMIELHNVGCQLALPVVQGRGKPLLFRAWRPGDPLEQGVFGTLQPWPARATLEPDALIVPMLACDEEGWRLGYGGGFYDRTLSTLQPKPYTVGLGFTNGFLEDFEPEPHDVPLDAILNDNGVVWPIA